MKNIVFVCTGNVCRSAAAEFVMKKLLAEQGITDIQVTSVGTEKLQSAPRDPELIRIAAENDYQISGTSRYMDVKELQKADLILVMADCHMDSLKSRLDFQYWDRIHLFMHYCLGQNETLMDPHFPMEAVYSYVFRTIELGCKALLEKLTLVY